MSVTSIAAVTVSSGAVAAPTRLRITRRGKAVLAALFAVPLLAITLVLAAVSGGAEATDTAGQTTTFEYVTIQPGDSLWQLAEEYAPSGDPRDFVADVISLNQLTSADVQVGQQIALPAA